MDKEYHFTAVLERFNSKLWAFHLLVPATIAEVFIAQDSKRVVCTLNEKESFQCALMPNGESVYFININKNLRDKLGLKLGTSVRVSIRKDDSKYGLPMPEELEELLRQDAEGSVLFQALTPGKLRTLLHIVGSVKGSGLRINRAIAVLDHLKENKGKIDYKLLHAALRKSP